MAPEVLANPSTSLDERTATKEELDARGIVPYTTQVDVWAAGILTYELLVSVPPFEVESEGETVKRIIQCDDIKFDNRFSPEWADFVKCGLCLCLSTPVWLQSKGALLCVPESSSVCLSTRLRA